MSGTSIPRRAAATLAAAVLVAMATAPAAAAHEPDPANTPVPRIIGGTTSSLPLEWPFMVAVGDAIGPYCGGSLIAPTWVLTAAHCFFDEAGNLAVAAADLQLLIGSRDVVTSDPGSEIKLATRIVIHPSYDDATSANDIALIELTSASAFGTTGLAGTENASRWLPGATATAKGWGNTVQPGESFPDLLREVDLPLLSDALCGGTAAGPDLIGGVMICAGDIANGGIDSCQGDSGGPLAVPDGAGGWLQVGVTSFGVDVGGISCGAANSPGVYTEVAAFRAWIESVSGVGSPTPVAGPPVGLVDPDQGLWHLRNSLGVVTSFFFGNPGDFPIMGDWDCDGIGTPGMYRQSDGFVYLRNSNTAGVADIRFFFGNPGDVPVAGDFNGNGCDTVSIYRPTEQRFYIINQLGANNGGLGDADVAYTFGDPGDKPFVGDFDGDGIETVGLHRESTGLVYFRNSHATGVADALFTFGNPGDKMVAGDWNASGSDSPALFRPGDTMFYFRFTNSAGNADAQFLFGSPPFLPVAGAFGLG